MSNVTSTLLAINDQLNKATKEIVGRIDELLQRDYLSEEDLKLLEGIKAGAQTLDDIVPDRVVEEAKEEEAEAETPSEESPADEA